MLILKMNLEDITLSKISWSQKYKCCVISLIGGIWSSEIHRNRKHNGGFQGLEAEEEVGIVVYLID